MILIYLLITSFYIAPNNPKISHGFQNWLSNKAPENKVKVWVFFTDKGIFKDSDYNKAIKSAEYSLVDRARTRRLKVRKAGELCDFSDIPVCKEYVERIQKLGAEKCVVSKWLNAVSFETSVKLINEIETFPFVKEVRKVMIYSREEDLIVKEVKGINYGDNCEKQLKSLNVPPAHDSGYSGKGVLIGVLDCGFDLRYHRCLQHLRDKVVAKYDFVGNDTILHYEPDNDDDKYCSFRHGSRMLSLIAGAKSAEVVGPAYGCSLALARTELDQGTDIIMEEHWWIAGTEYLDSIGVHIMSSSLGYRIWSDSSNYKYSDMDGHTTPMSIVASMLAGKGTLLVTAMGNVGASSPTFSPDTCIVAPADADSILAVGGVDTLGKWAWSGNTGSAIGPPYDQIDSITGKPLSLSQRTRWKPDVCGPFSTYLLDNPDSSNSYGWSGGTSCATALVAGVCALVLEAHPKWGPMETREAILSTASNHNSPNDTLGWGRPNAYKAIYNIELPEVKPYSFTKDEIFHIYPNPFKIGGGRELVIAYQLTNDSYAYLRIYTLSGKLVKEFEAFNQELGRHAFKWDGRNENGKLVGSGIYICLLGTYGESKDVKKFAVIRF